MGIAFVFFLLWVVLELIGKHIEKNQPLYEVIDEQPSDENQEDDIWNHPFIVAAGLTKPVEECEVEEVGAEEAPSCWSVSYIGEDKTPEYKVISLDTFNSKPKLLT